MKRFILVLSFLLYNYSGFALDNYTDSARKALMMYKDPIERFSQTIQYLEHLDSYQGNLVDSATCIDLLQIAHKLDNDSLLAISYDWIGYYFFLSKGDNTTSLEYYFKALPIAEKFNDKRRISSLYFDISGIYLALKNIDQFFYFSKKGGENLPDKSSPKYDYMLIQYQRNVGTAYMEKNQLDSANYYAQAALQTGERLKLPLFKFTALQLLGAVNSKMNENELADVYFKKALMLSDSLHSEIRKLNFFQRYIPFLLKNNRLEETNVLVNKLWSISENTENLNFKLAAAICKKDLFDKLNKTDSAYYYSKVESRIRELIFNQNNQNAIQALAFKEQLRLIEDADQKSEQEKQLKQNIQFELIAVGIISFIILFFIMSRSIIVTEKWISFFGILGLLIVFEFINLLIHPFLEHITDHSPLLMLVALVALASLLIPLHHKMEKWISEKMTEKNKKIRLEKAKRIVEELGEKQS